MAESLLVTQKELSVMFGVHPHTILAMRRDGKLPPPLPVSTRTCIRWSRKQIVEWMDGGCVCEPEWAGMHRAFVKGKPYLT